MRNNQFVKEISQNGCSYFIFIEIAEKEFEIVLTDCSSVWCGSISFTSLAEVASQVYYSVHEVINEIKIFFTNCQSNVFIKFDINKDENVILKFRKYVDRDIYASLQLCSILLTPKSNTKEYFQNILRFNITQFNYTSMCLIKTESDLSARTKELTDVSLKLEALITDKVEKDQNLFANFAQVLNAKKRKIEILEEERNSLRPQCINSCSNISQNDVVSDINMTD